MKKETKIADYVITHFDREVMFALTGYKTRTLKSIKQINMKKKVVYVTQWVAKDPNKEYPHGWGFEPPIVEFPQDMDAAEASKHCKALSNDEFECIGATAREFIDGNFEILGIVTDDSSNAADPIKGQNSNS